MIRYAAVIAVGYVLGAKAGRRRYEQIASTYRAVTSNPATKAVLLYVESVTSARKFMSAARAASRGKPVIVVKSGRHPAASAAAKSHTGAMAGSDAVYDAAFRRAGLLRVTR